MNRHVLAAVAAALLLPATLPAQIDGPGLQPNFKDTAVIVFEDLGCPACAHAHPIEEQVAAQYHVPLVRYDYPIAAHIWTFDGAVCARYLQDHVSPQLADQYRTAVFAAQASIASKDDLQRFTQRFMQQHNQPMPFVLDPGGALAAKVRADYEVGRRLNVEFTPTVVVVTRDRYQVLCGTRTGNTPEKLAPTVAAALAQTQTRARPN
jgi:protein-disulfide isomerase